MEKEKKERGRPGFNETKHVGVKMEKTLEIKFIMRAKELDKKGFRTIEGRKITKSDLIRTLAEYWLDHAEDIYAEKAAG